MMPRSWPSSSSLRMASFAVFAVVQRALVHVHADEAVCQLRVEVARELHGVGQRLFAMIQSVLDAVAERLGHGAHGFFPRLRRMALPPSGSGRPVSSRHHWPRSSTLCSPLVA